MAIDVSASQPENEHLSMNITKSGIAIDCNVEHPENVYSQMQVIKFGVRKWMDIKPGQPLISLPPMQVNDTAIVTVSNPEQFKKVQIWISMIESGMAIDVNFLLDSKAY